MISIRKAERFDAEQIFEIRSRAIFEKCSRHYSPDVLDVWAGGSLSNEFIDLVETGFFVAIKNNNVIASGMIDMESGAIDGIFVDPEFMGCGAAKLMMKHLESIAVTTGINQLKLDSTLNAVEFYRSCGFEGDRVSTYRSPRGIELECVPMVKIL
ncbi:MAG: GNAT family N-acetyltransferase [Pseudomonadales bacterium]|nr:GNAT family N-acetyltransferase [Pseudomonadales bacterium]